jgi:hypothetical protein
MFDHHLPSSFVCSIRFIGQCELGNLKEVNHVEEEFCVLARRSQTSFYLGLGIPKQGMGIVCVLEVVCTRKKVGQLRSCPDRCHP